MNGISGCITAIITPFDKGLQVDYQGLERIVELQIKGGVSGLVPLGTTGESPTISGDERRRIIETVIKKANGRVLVIVGTGSNSTEEAIKHTIEAQDQGADGALVVTPYYNKPSQEGIYRHFRSISKATKLPVIVYNIASRTGVNIKTDTMVRISGLDNVVGVKESSGNIEQMMEVIERVPKGFAVLSGDDNFTFPLMALGGCGTISVVSNLLPKRVSQMVEAMLAGDIERGRKLHFELMPIFRDAFIEPNPVPIKTAMALSGMPAGGVRQPLCEMLPDNLERLKKTVSMYSELKAGRAKEGR